MKGLSETLFISNENYNKAKNLFLIIGIALLYFGLDWIQDATTWFELTKALIAFVIAVLFFQAYRHTQKENINAQRESALIDNEEE